EELLPGLKSGAERTEFTGIDGSTRRLGRAAPLRLRNDRAYDRERREAGHFGPYMPLLLEACREEQFSYEYRDGVTSYGAFTYTLTERLKQARQAGRKLSFEGLVKSVSGSLKALGYEQNPVLVGPTFLKRASIPWIGRK